MVKYMRHIIVNIVKKYPNNSNTESALQFVPNSYSSLSEYMEEKILPMNTKANKFSEKLLPVGLRITRIFLEKRSSVDFKKLSNPA